MPWYVHWLGILEHSVACAIPVQIPQWVNPVRPRVNRLGSGSPNHRQKRSRVQPHHSPSCPRTPLTWSLTGGPESGGAHMSVTTFLRLRRQLSPSRSFAHLPSSLSLSLSSPRSPTTSPPTPPPDARKRRGEPRRQERREGMAMQTGFATSKVLILVGAGLVTATSPSSSSSSSSSRSTIFSSIDSRCGSPRCVLILMRWFLAGVELQGWRARSCCGMAGYLTCWRSFRSVDCLMFLE